MNISFKNKKLATVLNSKKEILRRYGTENGKTIMRRLAVLEASPTLADIPDSRPERRHQLEGNRKGQFAVDIKHPFRIVFVPNHKPIPRKQDGGIDLSRITDITIIDIEDYH